MQLTPDDVKQADILVSKILDSLNRGEDVVIKARKKVEPMQGPFYLTGNGDVCEESSLALRHSDMGLAFNTLDQTRTARPIIRRVGRYLNWVLANCPGHDPSGEGIALALNEMNDSRKWVCFYTPNLSGLHITAPTDKAQELCELLNSGRYTL